MKTFFYPKLAASGIKKNGRIYIPYLLTCIGMVMMSYILFFLMESRQVSAMRGGQTLQQMLSFGSGIFSVFSVIFLFYTNSFLMRRRKQEFGLYNILGMGKKNLAGILFWETVLMSVVSLVCGLLLGILFSKFAELCMAWVLAGDAGFGFSVEWSAVNKTVLTFLIIFGCIFLNGLRQVWFSRPIDLIRSSSVGEKAPKGNVFFASAGVLLLAGAYDIAVTIKDPLSALLGFFIAVLMVILATYLLFIAGSVVLCRILKKNKKYYYQVSHFVSVSSMMYRMKRNGAGLASICILSTMVLVAVSATASLYMGKESFLKARYPYEVQIELYFTDEEKTAHAKKLVEKKVAEQGLTIKEDLTYRYLSIGAMLKEDQAILDQSSVTETELDYSKIVSLYFVPLEDYNRIMGTEETLSENEVLICGSREYGYDTFSLEGYGVFQVVSSSGKQMDIPENAASLSTSMMVILPDTETLLKVDQAQKFFYGERSSSIRTYYGCNLGVSDGEQILVTEELLKEFDTWTNEEEAVPHYFISCIASERADFYGLYGGLFVLGILLGIVFLLATVLIMYYKQVSEGYEDQSRFEVMQKVGMTKKGIKKSINSQMLTVFLLPLATAGLHLGFAFPIVSKMLQVFGLMDNQLLILVTAACYLVFTLFYMLMYRLTSRAYYRIVGGEKE